MRVDSSFRGASRATSTKATTSSSTCRRRESLLLAPRRNRPSAAARASAASAAAAAASSSSAAAAAAATTEAAAPPLPTPSPSPSPSSSPPSPPPPFSWTAHWYPVAFVDDLPRDVPTAFKLLGTRLAIYHEAESDRWVTLEDSCPHRRAPLSQGRVLREETSDSTEAETTAKTATRTVASAKKATKTVLECSYHGWRFDGEGSCVAIPQLDGCPSLVPAAVASSARRSPRACAVPRPCRVAQGMLWVWGEGPRRGREPEASEPTSTGAGEDAVSRMFREADEKEPPYAPGISIEDYGVPSDAMGKGKEKLLTLAGRYTRDVEYDATTLMDNLLDTSHLAYAHNRVLGDRDADDAGDVAVTRVTFDPSTGLELEGDASAPPSAGESDGRGGVGVEPEEAAGRRQHRYLDSRSASARALRSEHLTGDAATFDASFRVPRSDGDGRATQRVVFEPPSLSFWMIDRSPDPVTRGSRWRCMPIYVTPTEPGRCRILFQIRYPDSPELNRLLTLVVNRLTPEWVSHCSSSLVTDGDSRLLWPTEARARDAILGGGGLAREWDADVARSASPPSSDRRSPPAAPEDIGRAFFRTNYMPAPADAPIVAYRKWLFSRGGGGPFGSPFAPSPLLSPTSPLLSPTSPLLSSASPSSSTPEHVAVASVLSRYEQHTKNCKSCSAALRNAVATKKVAGVAALLLASAAAGAAGSRAPAVAVARWAAASAVAAFAAWGASRVERSLTYTGYDHSRMH